MKVLGPSTEGSLQTWSQPQRALLALRLSGGLITTETPPQTRSFIGILSLFALQYTFGSTRKLEALILPQQNCIK
jgi:hypothetical protein